MNLSTNKVTQYLKESKEELKKVSWPTRKQTINHTIMVISVSLFIAAFLAVLDYVFITLLEKII